MKDLKMDKKTCEVCGKNKAVDICAGCGKALCRECRKMEIWGSGAEDLTVKYFCPRCKEDPDINPWGAYDKVFDLEDVVDMTNRVRNVA